jgi:enterochelin esterase-like enzyme
MRRILSYAAYLAPQIFFHIMSQTTLFWKKIQTQNKQHPEALTKLFKILRFSKKYD